MTDDQTTTPARPSKAKLAGIFAAVAFGVYVFFSVGHHASPADGDTPSVPRGEAWNSCKSAVAEQLRHPDSADFALLSTDFSEVGAGWSITGSLKAENDYGVKDELGYSCKVAPDGTVTAHVEP